jgi:hypothetical protein
LIVADLFFNLTPAKSKLDRFARALAGIGESPRPSRLWSMMIQDRSAFAASIQEILSWDFDRIIPGHGECVHSNGKPVLAHAFKGPLKNKFGF